MSITTFNQYPYYDDFDGTKNYMRILFRPGYSVQARELNQLQTAIQAQIDRFGSSIYKENARVLGGEVTINNKVPYLKVENNYGNFSVNGDTANGIRSYLAKNADGSYQIVGKILRGTARGVSINDIGNIRAEVVDIIPPVYESVGGTSVIKHPLTLQLRYLNSGGTPNAADDSLVNYFSPDEVITTEDNSFTFKAQSLDSNGAYPTGYGTRLFAEEAVYFVKGCFVHVPQSSINVTTYSQTPYRRVVYNIIENVVTSATDPSLNDNSIGTPNESAPGANRYQIILNLGLDSFDVNKKLSKDVIEIAKIRAGKLVGKEVTQYSELGKVLARRTYEESGNYYLTPIPLTTSELLKNVNDLDSDYVGGMYTESQIRNFYTTDTPVSYGRERLALSVGKGGNVAYVYGYRIEFLDSQIVSTLKARDTSFKNNASVDGRVGNYLVCSIDESSSSSYVDLKYEPLEIYNASDELIGTARVRNIEYHSSTQLKIFLSNVTQLFDTDGLPIDSLSNMSYLASTQSADDFVFNIVENTFVDENYHSYIFKNPCSVTKSVSDISYVVRDSLSSFNVSNVSVVGDTITLTVKNPVTDQFEYSGINSFLVIDADDGSIIEFESVELQSSSTVAKITFDTSNVISSNFIVYFDLKKTEQTSVSTLRRSKTLTQANEVISNPNRDGGGLDYLINYDIKRIIGVYTTAAPAEGQVAPVPTDQDIDITDHYILDNGQRENYYDLGALRLRCGCDGPPDGSQLRVYYEYYEWSQTGEYFTADSYYTPEEVLTEVEGFNYETIPTFNSLKYGEINLRDVIDFRPKLSEIESQTAITLARLPRIIGDFTFYLPRIDKLYINKDGELGIARGISSETPSAPAAPDEVMVLYTMRMNAYTFHPDDYVKTVHNHRRYTMKDIAKLDKRITDLEIFTTLKTIEEETKNEQILDENGDDRFKNGFLADPCGGHIVGYTKDFEYSVAVNLEEGNYSPITLNNDIRFILDEENTTSDYRTIGSKLLLPFAEVKYTGSPYATKPVEIVPPPPQPLDPVYSLVSDKTQATTDDVIRFRVTTENVDDGTKVWWIIDQQNLFDGHYTRLYGQLNIYDEEAEFSLTVNPQTPLSQNQIVKVTLRADANGVPESYNTNPIGSNLSDLTNPVSINIIPKEITPPVVETRWSSGATPTPMTDKNVNRLFYYDSRRPKDKPAYFGGLFQLNRLKIRFWATDLTENTEIYWNIVNVSPNFIKDTRFLAKLGHPSLTPSEQISEEDFTDDLGFSGSFTVTPETTQGNEYIFYKELKENPEKNLPKFFAVQFRLKPLSEDSNERTNPIISSQMVTVVDWETNQEIYDIGDRIEIRKTSEITEGVIELSPGNDNYYSDTRPIILFDDSARGVFDVIKNSPNENDDFLSYIYEGDIQYWIGTDAFDDENSESLNISNRLFGYDISQWNNTGGVKVVSDQIALKIRSRKIYFEAAGLLPNTRYIPFFGGYDISAYTIKEDYREYHTIDDAEATKLYNGQTRHPNQTDSNKIIKTDSRGYVSGSFIIPNNTEKSFLTNTNFAFLLAEDPYGDTRNRSSAVTYYEATGNGNVTKKVYYVSRNTSNEENMGPIDTGGLSWKDWTNQNELEGSEFLDSNESILGTNLNLLTQNYQFEFYEETINVIDDSNGDVVSTSTLTLTGTRPISLLTGQSYSEALVEQNNIIYNSSITSKNVSGLYITEVSSGIRIDRLFDNPFYFESIRPGEYKIKYVRLVNNSETENNVNPISENANFDISNQRDISITLTNNEGNRYIGPNDSNL